MGKNNKRHDYEYIKSRFETKDYTLISTEYKNKNDKLDYICNKHKDVGIQKVSFASLEKNNCNCKKCIKLNSIGKTHKVPSKIEKHYDELFKKYEDKLKQQEDGNEYILNKIYSNNSNTMLDLIHLNCNKHYHVEQNKFFKCKNRCQNKECKSNRLRKRMTKTLEQLKNEVYELVGDEYEIISEYRNTNENVTFYHKLCNDTFEMTPHNFLQGNQRCTHCTRKPSIGEQAVIDVLNKMNIECTFQKSFDDLRGINGHPLSYDFYLKKYNFLIEYQGEYHDGSVSFVPAERIIKCQEYDQIKREYAKSHGIELLEIWYWDYDNIENILKDYLNLHNKNVG